MHLKRFGCSLWVLLIAVQSCKATACNCEGFYCVSDTEFQLCVNGETVGDRIPCITGLTCRNETEKECIPQLACQENKACTEEGMFPDEKFINKYFECVLDTNTLEWIKIEHTCPEGTYFSRETNTCHVGDDFTSLLEPEDARGDHGKEEELPASDVGYLCAAEGYFPNLSDCQTYYECTGTGVGKLVECPQNTYYNDEKSLCSSYKPERCHSFVNVKPELPSQIDKLTNEGIFLCSEPGHFLDPQNPQRFFVCDGENNVFVEYCPENTYFDFAYNACVIIKQENRLDLTTDTPTLTLTSSDKEETYSPTAIVIGTTEASKVKGTLTSQATKYLVSTTESPSKVDYYSTTSEITITSTLKSNNKEETNSTTELVIGTTDTSNAEDNYGSSVTSAADGVNVTESPSKGGYYSGTKISDKELISTRPSREEVFTCPGEGYFPDPKNCHGYFACFGIGSPVSMICPKNTYFDEQYAFCSLNMPERCIKDNPDQTIRPPENGIEKEFVCPSAGIFSDPKDCSKYWICFNRYFGFYGTCPEGTYYHESSSLCLKQKPERCKGPEDKVFKCSREGFFPDPQDCHIYHVCYTLGVHIAIPCPGNTYYDQESKACTYDTPRRCLKLENGNDRCTIGPSGLCKTSGDTATEKAHSPTMQGNPISPTDAADDNIMMSAAEDAFPTSADRGFECEKSGRYADPKDCRKYYFCSWQLEMSHLTCRNSMYFNDITNKCEEEIPARCQSALVSSQTWMFIAPDSPQKLICREGGNFPDKEDCFSYYYCPGEYSKPVRFKCPTNQYFNENKGRCSEMKNGDECSISENLQKSESSSSEESREDERFVCRRPGLFPDLRDCRTFYECSIKLEMKRRTCSGDTYFNEVLQFCSHFASRRCRKEKFW